VPVPKSPVPAGARPRRDLPTPDGGRDTGNCDSNDSLVAMRCPRLFRLVKTQGGLDVPEASNVEVAHKLSEQEESEQRRKHRWEEIAEVIEVLILATGRRELRAGGDFPSR
jgi:hypothetical protein